MTAALGPAHGALGGQGWGSWHLQECTTHTAVCLHTALDSSKVCEQQSVDAPTDGHVGRDTSLKLCVCGEYRAEAGGLFLLAGPSSSAQREPTSNRRSF